MNAKSAGGRRRLRLGATGLLLMACAGAQLVESSASSASTVTKPALAKTSHGRFLDTIVLDRGIVTVTPAPAGVKTVGNFSAVSAKIWASSQFSGFTSQTFGYGYVTVRGAAPGEARVHHLLAWVAFANGDASNVCALDKDGKFRTNGEAAVVLGDAESSPTVAYVPPNCGIAQRKGYTVPGEVISVPWAKVGDANRSGIASFRTTTAECGSISGTTRVRSARVLEVTLYVQRPDLPPSTCSPALATLGMPLAKNGATANALTLVHGPLGPVRQVVAAFVSP